MDIILDTRSLSPPPSPHRSISKYHQLQISPRTPVHCSAHIPTPLPQPPAPALSLSNWWKFYPPLTKSPADVTFDQFSCPKCWFVSLMPWVPGSRDFNNFPRFLPKAASYRLLKPPSRNQGQSAEKWGWDHINVCWNLLIASFHRKRKKKIWS